jgi:transketolase
MDDLKAFRQIDSKTPGHPEAGHTDGTAKYPASNAI